MKSFLRGTSTVEVMVILVAVSMVISTSYAGKAFALQVYLDGVHQERAQLYAQETFEQLEVIRLSRRQQNHQRSWDIFLGNLADGSYQILRATQMNELALTPTTGFFVDPILSVREYDRLEGADLENVDGLYSRLERRIFIESVSDEAKKITVSVYWGLPGDFRGDHPDQIRLQGQYQDQVGPALVL
jgi:hypothetical protein